MAYRRSKAGVVWHFCRNCAGWPTVNYVERDPRPLGELCKECQERLQQGECR